MPKMHVLQASRENFYKVYVHAPTPGGANGVGTNWATALVNSGLAFTRMSIGTGPGQIASAEAAQIAAGTVIEAELVWEDNPNWTDPQRIADLSLRADQAVAQLLSEYASKLKYFGYTVA